MIESHERRDVLVIINMIHFNTTFLHMCVELTCFSTRAFMYMLKKGMVKRGPCSLVVNERRREQEVAHMLRYMAFL